MFDIHAELRERAAMDEISRLRTALAEAEERIAALEGALTREREGCVQTALVVGNFGDYERGELTPDYGQPRFDMMNEIVEAIRSRSPDQVRDQPKERGDV
jgi:hypothetical protein